MKMLALDNISKAAKMNNSDFVSVDISTNRRRKKEKQENEDKERRTEDKERKTENISTEAEEEEDEKSLTFQYFLEMVGTNGLWNYWVFFLAAMCSFFSPFQSLSYQFLGDTPDHWCHIPELVEANWTQQQIIDFAIPFNNGTGEHEKCTMRNLNYTAAVELGYEESNRQKDYLSLYSTNGKHNDTNDDIIPCKYRDFNFTDHHSTTVTQWDLVCERRYLYSTTFSASFFVRLFTSPLIGYLLDIYGRRRSIVVSVALYIPMSFLAAFSVTYEFYILLRILISQLDACIYIGGFVLCLEFSGKSQRAMAGILFCVPWALGYMTLPGIAYLVRDWQYLQAALTLPSLFMILYFWILPESPRWLMSKGRFEEASEILVKAAKMNGRSLKVEAILQQMKALSFQEDLPDGKECCCTRQGCQNKIQGFFNSIWGLVRSLALLRMTLIVLFTWFVSSVTYYGMSLNAVNLSANVYIYMFLGGLLEVPSYVLLWPIVSLLGRKRAFMTLFMICGICISIIPLLDGVVTTAPVAVKVTLSLLGKMAINMAFQLAYLYTGELYQTSQRSFVISLGNVFSAAGGAAAPYINDIFVETATWAPPVTFAVFSVLAAVLTIFLPETKNVELPETVVNVESSPSGRSAKSPNMAQTGSSECNKVGA